MSMSSMSMSSMSMTMSGTMTDTMSMATATDGSMPMSTSSSDDPMTMGMDSMAMVFFTSTSTSLWSMAFTPNTTGQYAGTCIFLIAFAAIFRLLLAIRVNFFEIIAAAKKRRTAGLLQPYEIAAEGVPRPWRASEAVMLGAMDVVIAGVSYLLMLAVMTMNVGYFLSILGGVFVGSILCGRYTGHSGAH
ncbi:hypothetical protein EV356DRAFT_508154 [Viridothelium virens]|uniref:Copper transport protein n=1 Tax=Viridothelium virens TaxID=1048519 RepID=A0A6A6GYL6_VIRVR|nr:hypothetical protein EV356DRAFT_508154 [Viridothelium virens]